MILPLIDFKSIHSIEELNDKFLKLLGSHYHLKIHSSTNQTPKDRFMKSLSQNSVKYITENELDLAFYQSFFRLVKKDSTVSVHSKTYEVPPEFIGQKVELRSPLDRPANLTLYENGQPFCPVKPVNLIENFEKPHTGIHFKEYEKYLDEQNNPDLPGGDL